MTTGIKRTQHVVILTVALLFALGSWAAYATEDDKEKHANHFKCYSLAEKGKALNEPVTLEDQFHNDKDAEHVKVKNPHLLCTPVTKKRDCYVDKWGDEHCKEEDKAEFDSPHLLCWKIAPSGPPVQEEVKFPDSQFDDDRIVKVQTSQFLCEFVTKKKLGKD